MFGALIRGVTGGLAMLGRNTVAATRAAAKIPIVSQVAKQTAIGAGLYAAGNALFPGGKSGLPALPGLPALHGAVGFPGMPGAGDRSIFRDDPNIVAALQPWAIPARGLRPCYRAPKGFVVRYDSAGDPYGIPKKLAQAYLGWKPAKKPPISVGDWQAVKRADRTIKKMRKITSTMTTVDKNIRGGKVVVRRKKKS